MQASDTDSDGDTERKYFHVDMYGWLAIAIGLMVGWLAYITPLARFIISILTTIIHEFGHTLIAWLFGYPAIPSLDLKHGGGYAARFEQSRFVLLPIAIGAVWFLWSRRKHKKVVRICLACLGIYLLFLFTDLHQLLILYMGQGMELLIAAIFLHRAISNHAVHHLAERLLYAVIGFHLIIDNTCFAWRLLFDDFYYREYVAGKAPGMLNDFYRMWSDYLKRLTFDHIAWGHLILSLMAAPLAYAFHYMTQNRWDSGDRQMAEEELALGECLLQGSDRQ